MKDTKVSKIESTLSKTTRRQIEPLTRYSRTFLTNKTTTTEIHYG